MREIKFRAWNTEESPFTELRKTMTLSKDLSVDNCLYNQNGDGPSTTIIMQFTGLLDKYKREIYEGDICRGPNGKHWIIEWMGYAWCITNENIPNGPTKFSGSETYTIDKWLALPPRKQDLEIIGNIYENPERRTLTN